MTISSLTGKILDIFDSPDSELTVWGENNQQDPSADSWASIMALLLHQMDITVGVFSFVRVPNGQKVKIFFSQHHHMIFRGQMQNLPTYFSNKKKHVFRRRKCGHNNNSRPHTWKVSFISHLVAFMYLESTENCAYGPLFKNCYCLWMFRTQNIFLGVTTLSYTNETI